MLSFVKCFDFFSSQDFAFDFLHFIWEATISITSPSGRKVPPLMIFLVFFFFFVHLHNFFVTEFVYMRQDFFKHRIPSLGIRSSTAVFFA